MYYLELERDDNLYRISWNGSATYNIQIPIGGQWVDIECFTCYEYDNPSDALAYAVEWMDTWLEQEDE